MLRRVLCQGKEGSCRERQLCPMARAARVCKAWAQLRREAAGAHPGWDRGKEKRRGGRCWLPPSCYRRVRGNDHSPAAPTSAPTEALRLTVVAEMLPPASPKLPSLQLRNRRNPQDELIACGEAFLFLLLGLPAGQGWLWACAPAQAERSACLYSCSECPGSALRLAPPTALHGGRWAGPDTWPQPWLCAQPLLPGLDSAGKSNSPLMYEQSSITGDR